MDKDTIEFHAGRLTKLERYIRTYLTARELAEASGKPVGVVFLEHDEMPCPVCEIRKAFTFALAGEIAMMDLLFWALIVGVYFGSGAFERR